MGQIVGIIKHKYGNCTNGGVTGGNASAAFIVNVFGNESEADARSLPRLALVDHPAGPSYDAILVPVDADNNQIRKGMGRPMFGGNSAELDDGRIVNIHDRFETTEQYERLSR